MNPSVPFPAPHAEINALLHRLHLRVQEALGEYFVGMYLYGSLATGGFDPGRSDVDFVVLTRETLPQALIEALRMMHMAMLEQGDPWVSKLEGAYLTPEVLRRHESTHPPVPTLNEGNFYLAPLGNDWIIQRKVLRETSVAIAGPPLNDWIDPVTDDAVKEAVLNVLADWWAPMLDDPSPLHRPGYQPFAVLSMCRALHTLTTGGLTSKEAAATWAKAILPDTWAPLIDHAHRWQYGTPIASIEHTLAFMKFVMGMCHRLGVRPLED